MEPQLISAILGLAGGLASGAIAAWAILRSKHLDAGVEEVKLQVSVYDTKLLEQRLTDYRKLWALTEKTSRRNIEYLSPEDGNSLAKLLTRWYYQDGGIILSEESRHNFFRARESLESHASAGHLRVYHSVIVTAFSRLRVSLCQDINSRRGPTSLGSREEDSEHKFELAVKSEAQQRRLEPK